MKLDDLPGIFPATNYRVDPYIRTAVRFQRMGQEKAVAELKRLAADDHEGNKTLVLCRMLFSRREGGEFRRPRIGGFGFIGGTSYNDWPLDPVEIVDGIPFLVLGAGGGTGLPEHPKAYLAYCLTNCDWSTATYTPKNEAQKRQALEKLLADPRLKGRVSDSEQEFLTKQLTPVSETVSEVHRALERGKTHEALALLVQNQVLIESQDDLQQTPLHVAAHRGRTEALKWLLAHKANVHATAYNHFTPLHLASNGEIAQALIKAGANLDTKDSWGNTPLQMAAIERRQPVVDAILATGYKLDLRTAILLRNHDAVKKILQDDPGIAKQPTKGSSLKGCTTPLGLACSQRDKELVTLLLEAGADVNETTFMPNAGGNASPLTNAVWAGDAQIVELLLKHGAKTNVVGGKAYRTIVDYARKHSSPEIVRLLEKANP